MSKPPLAQRRGWARRAVTLHRNAEALFSDIMKAVGPEHAVTDDVDNVLVATADLCAVLEGDHLLIWKEKPHG